MESGRDRMRILGWVIRWEESSVMFMFIFFPCLLSEVLAWGAVDQLTYVHSLPPWLNSAQYHYTIISLYLLFIVLLLTAK